MGKNQGYNEMMDISLPTWPNVSNVGFEWQETVTFIHWWLQDVAIGFDLIFNGGL